MKRFLSSLALLVGLAAYAMGAASEDAVCMVSQDHCGGSGTFVGQNEDLVACVVSAAHVFRHLGDAAVKVDGSAYRASVWAIDRPNDVAILFVPLDRPVQTLMVAGDDPPIGAPVWKIGYPAWAQGAIDVSKGKVIATPPVAAKPFYCTCIGRPGDSGGAIVNADGDLVSELYGFPKWDPYVSCGSGPGPIRRMLGRAGWGNCIRRRQPMPKGPEQEQQPEAPPPADPPKTPPPPPPPPSAPPAPPASDQAPKWAQNLQVTVQNGFDTQTRVLKDHEKRLQALEGKGVSPDAPPGPPPGPAIWKWQPSK